MKAVRKLRKVLTLGFAILLFGGIGSLALVYFCSVAIREAADGQLYGNVAKIPKRNSALVLGCSRTLTNGRENLFFRYRIEAAAELYHSGKVSNLLVSGDNGSKSYDEPSDMADALVALGVPEDRIYKDYAGFRTLDSVVRARDIFGQTSFIVVSQPFHNERAIYLASKHGIDALGYNATDVVAIAGLRTKLRENLARVKTVLDVLLLKTKPKFLGPPVKIPDHDEIPEQSGSPVES